MKCRVARCAAAVILVLGLATASSGVRADGERLPVPSKEAARAATAKVREIFAADAAKANTPEEKSKLSGELIGHARDTEIPVERYVLLEAARSLAMEAGDVTNVLAALQLTASQFAIDLPNARTDALEALATKAPPASLGRVVDLLLEAADTAANDNAMARAEGLAQTAATAARRAKDRDRQKKAIDQLAEIRERRKLLAKAKPLEEKLAADPTDREAATDLGRFRCFVEDDWDAGLPLLARGADPDLAALAQAEINVARDASSRMALADNWWAFATSAKGPEAAAAEGRARLHYGMILEDLSGLERARVVKRLESAASGGGPTKRPKGLVLWLDSGAPGSLRTADNQVIDGKKSTVNSSIATWADVNATPLFRQSTPSAMPACELTGAGRRPAVSFSGRSIMVSDFKPPRAGTLAVACVPRADAVNMKCLGEIAGKPGIRLAFRQNNAVWFEVMGDAPFAEYVGSADQVFRRGQLVVVVASWPTPFAIRAGDTEKVAPTPPKGNPSEAAGTVLGAMNNSGIEGFQGLLAELRIYDRILDATEAQTVRRELNGKWSLLGR